MVIDTSALVAILFAEPEAERLTVAIARDPVRIVGAPTLVETSAVLRARRGPQGIVALDALVQRLGITIAPLTEQGALHARAAYDRFGKGIGNPGVLNFGDCLSYGMARDTREPLLFKGHDFSCTDVEAVGY